MVKFKCTDVSGSKMVQSQEIECTVKVNFRMEELYTTYFSLEHKRRCIPLQHLYSIQHNGKSIHTHSGKSITLIPFHFH